MDSYSERGPNLTKLDIAGQRSSIRQRGRKLLYFNTFASEIEGKEQ